MANMEYKIVAGMLGGAATFVVQKLIRASWKTITGDEPPNPSDPEASTVAAVSWVAASAVGVAVAQVLVQRLVAKRYDSVGKGIKFDRDDRQTIKAQV